MAKTLFNCSLGSAASLVVHPGELSEFRTKIEGKGHCVNPTEALELVRDMADDVSFKAGGRKMKFAECHITNSGEMSKGDLIAELELAVAKGEKIEMRPIREKGKKEVPVTVKA